MAEKCKTYEIIIIIIIIVVDFLENDATVNRASYCHLPRVATHWLSGKEKVPGAVVSKEGHNDNLLNTKGPITIDFLEKDATVNSASYCQISPYLLIDPCILELVK